MSFQKGIGNTMEKSSHHCVAITKTKSQCKNIGKWLSSGDYYCCKHAPKKQISCVICLSPIIDAYYLSCGHYFHRKCISRWLKKSNNCPTCREPVIDMNVLKTYQDIFNRIHDNDFSIAIDIAIQCKSREEFLNKLGELQLI